MALWKNGEFVEDPWRTSDVADDANPPLAGGVVLSLAEWKTMRGAGPGDNQLLAVRIEPGESVAEIADDLGRLAMVALAFPKFNDGRAFSKAHQLREEYGYKGEVRAVGEVLWDQLQLMRRCGFDAFDITNEPTLKALRAGKTPVMTDFYQPGFGPETRDGAPRRAWTRRAI